MAHKSLRERYRSVTEVPEALLAFSRAMASSNSTELLSLLLSSPAEAAAGEYQPYSRKVLLRGFKLRTRASLRALMREVSPYVLESTVVSLNYRLKRVKLPYRIWFSCERRLAQKRRQTTPFRMGLVDLRYPLTADAREASPRAG